MIAKTIFPKKEKILPSKTIKVAEGIKEITDDYDFFRITPEERIDDYENADAAIRATAEKGPVLTAGDEITASEPIIIRAQPEIIRTLEQLYDKRQRPTAIVFDYKNPRTNAHCYLREIYLQQNLHIFRHIPVLVINYDGNSPMVDPINVLAINGSPRKNGDTKRLLLEEIAKYWTGPYYNAEVIDLPPNLQGCQNCGGMMQNCKPGCVIEDKMRELLPKTSETDVLLIGTPVYMDTATPQTWAFLSRLTNATKFNRRAFIGKYATALSPAWCSGTKATISTLLSALEMLGFTIQGRSTREYVQLWPDGKTRGGVPHNYYWPE